MEDLFANVMNVDDCRRKVYFCDYVDGKLVFYFVGEGEGCLRIPFSCDFFSLRGVVPAFVYDSRNAGRLLKAGSCRREPYVSRDLDQLLRIAEDKEADLFASIYYPDEESSDCRNAYLALRVEDQGFLDMIKRKCTPGAGILF